MIKENIAYTFEPASSHLKKKKKNTTYMTEPIFKTSHIIQHLRLYNHTTYFTLHSDYVTLHYITIYHKSKFLKRKKIHLRKYKNLLQQSHCQRSSLEGKHC